MAAILSVFHQHETGWHTYTSPQLPGLFLTGPDEDALSLSAALPSTICALIEAADQCAVLIRRAESYRSRAAGHNAKMGDVLHFLVTSAEADASVSDDPLAARRNNDIKARRRNRQG